MTTMFKKFATGTAALALMTTVFASTTMAAEGTSTTEIQGAENVTMTGVSTSNFGMVQLSGATQTTTAQLDIASIIDARGTGDGWNVTVKAQPLSLTEDGSVLSENKLTLAVPTVQKVDGGSSEVSTIATSGGNIDNANGVNILTAQGNGGMGSFTIDPIAMTLTLLPKEVFSGNYSTTVSVELTNGPQS
ncbi:WxL domain-containing protein [Planococcus sp. YIM B11945]|uniref:WxL domain-containing protein n=1 Tax=Planococcus sp. YIM B11945 TaxID=3435410 RepID=UPI003D7D5D98